MNRTLIHRLVFLAAAAGAVAVTVLFGWLPRSTPAKADASEERAGTL